MYTNFTHRLTLLLLSILVWGGGWQVARAQQNVIPQSEFDILRELYDKCGGTNWAEGYNWRATDNPQNWMGIVIEQGHVVGITLQNVGLTGQLPEKLFAQLPNLKLFAVPYNELTGPIPPVISTLTQLKGLALSHNRWSGQLPNLDNLVNLQVLDLAYLIRLDNKGDTISMVSGVLPNLSRMPNLEYVDCCYSGLTGQIPEQIGLCTKLKKLDLSMNSLEGPLPASIAQCRDLRILSVMENKLSGELPDLSPLTNLGMNYEMEFGRLYLNSNQFTGPFPEGVLQMSQLKRFSCANNQLSGTLPEDLTGLSNLEAFFVDHNQFSGTLPKYLGEQLWDVDFSSNKFEGSIPKTWEQAPELGKVSVNHNYLSGPVPPIFKQAKQMDLMDVRKNCFSFANFKDWSSFIKHEETIFRFGVQRPYTDNERLEVHAGQEVTLDATYPGTLIGDEDYRWYNMTTLEPVPNASDATFTIPKVSKQDAVRYVCLISSEKMGSSQPQSGHQLRSSEEQQDINLQPTLASGFWDIVVDGYFNGLEGTLAPTSETLPLYYDRATGELRILSERSVLSMMIVDMSGVIVATFPTVQAQTIEANLLPGRYIALMNDSEGGSCATTFIVE